jgi:murein L,D-transpeptidase YcbB/YkuD
MSLGFNQFRMIHFLGAVISTLVVLLANPAPVSAQVTAFKQAVAEAAARDKDIAAFYQSNGYSPIWTSNSSRDKSRRAALMDALNAAGEHGLPQSRYAAQDLMAKMKAAKTPRDLGLLEVEISRTFLQYARDVQTGVLVPSQVDKDIVRAVPYRDRTSYLINFTKSSPKGFFKTLPPKTREYNALMKQKLLLEMQLANGGWGPKVPGKALKLGQSGNDVVVLRNRLIAMGFMTRSASQTYNGDIEKAVQAFQLANGLTPDGVAGPGTITEINTSTQERLQSVIVAMERERWFNRERGKRHVLVNLTDFSAKIIDDNKITFETRTVVGKNVRDQRSPEFSDVMEFMIVNPSWYVPRSIVTKEYLPALQQDPYAASHIEITDSRGRAVNRDEVDFTQFTERTFPFAMRQPPSRGNALGLVKFMFPNQYNIYLHDTPAKNLFGRESRAYSHGCIRLADPFDFAYALLAKQTSDPQSYFKSQLATGKEVQIDLKQPVPTHIIYRTAFTNAKGELQFRRDVYGRDAKIWDALRSAGVALREGQG